MSRRRRVAGVWVLAGAAWLMLGPACERGSGDGRGGDGGGTGVPPARALGVNVSGIADWSTAWPFGDAFMSARPWVAQRADRPGVWDTGESIVVTPAGWPARLEPGQVAATLLLHAQSAGYPAGRYQAEFRGRGEVAFGQDARAVRTWADRTSAGDTITRVELEVTPTALGMLVRITATDPADPVRDLRVWMPGASRDGVIAREYVESLRGFGVLRFMDWQAINDSPLARWGDRSTTARATQAGRAGGALELALDLAEAAGADAWLCVPHLADDEHVAAMAGLVRDRLGAGRVKRVFVEWSNEVWNEQFAQAREARERGVALGLARDPTQAGLRFTARRAGEVMAIMERELGPAARDASGGRRLVRVLATNIASTWATKELLGFEDAARSVDVLAVAPYFGGEFAARADAGTLTVERVLDLCEEDLARVERLIKEQAALARRHGLRLVAYEAGQHLVAPMDRREDARLARVLDEANRHERMGRLYTGLLRSWVAAGGDEILLYMHIAPPGPWGRWGLLEHQRESTSAKMDAARRFGDELLANIDGGRATPMLTTADVAAFDTLWRAWAGRIDAEAAWTRANCDGSTTPPAVNVMDYACFMLRWARGRE